MMNKVWILYSYPYLDKEKVMAIHEPLLRAVIGSPDLVHREISRWFDYLINDAAEYGTDNDVIEEICRAILAEEWFSRINFATNGNGSSRAAYGVSIECYEVVEK